MQQRGISSPNSIKKILQYHIKSKHIISIRRGLYAVLNPITDSAESFYVDPFIVAGQATADAVLAYHTALELHDLAYTTFETLTFLTKMHVKSFNFQTQTYKPVRIPTILIKKGQKNFGINRIKRSGLNISVTSLERTIVDIIDRPELGGGWEEICRSLENLVIFDTRKVVEYLLLLGNTTTVARVGFFLEKLNAAQGVDKSLLNQLEKHLPKQPCYLDRNKREQGTLIREWNLIVPDSVLNTSWEEGRETNI